MSELQTKIYFILAAPFLIAAALVLGLLFAPLAGFVALTVRPALRWEGGFAVNAYAWTLALAFVLSLCWPLAVLYGISRL